MPITTTLTGPTGSAYTFQSWTGYITGRHAVPDVYHRLGQDGSGVQSLGHRAKVTPCTAIALYATAASAISAATALEKFSAEIVTVADGFGFTSRCLVHDATAIVVAGKHGYAGVSYPYRVEARFDLELVGDLPTVAGTAV